jgi:hypothetical protein
LRVAGNAGRARGGDGDDRRRRVDALWHSARLDDPPRRLALAAVDVISRYLAPLGYLAFALQEVTLYVIDSCLEVARRFSPTAAGLVAGFSAPARIALDAQGRVVAESTIRDGFPAREDLGVLASAGLVLSRDLVIVTPAAPALTVRPV